MEDVLKIDLNKLIEEEFNGMKVVVCANLPYYITTPIIMGLFESHVPIDSITIMVQKEVADRMQVGPGTKDYGALSLAVQYYARPEIVANIMARKEETEKLLEDISDVIGQSVDSLFSDKEK